MRALCIVGILWYTENEAKEGTVWTLYRVLLVDDEEDIRVGISRKMDWEGLGFAPGGRGGKRPGGAGAGRAAQPDVVLTDIKCPLWTGWSCAAS